MARTSPAVWPIWTILAITTLLELLAYEFGYWFAHYLFHIFPALWEFHKVHHSAEVLTPLTEMRTHPVEIIAFMNVIGFFTGVVFGVMTYAFGPGIRPFTLLNANAVLMLFIVTIGHLRHTNIWIPFTGLTGKLFQSPAHHQIHHSDQPRHFNKNLGFALAVWDWLFGTLYIPESHEKITFGVGAEHVRFDTLLRTFAAPFVLSAGHVAQWAGGLRARLAARRRRGSPNLRRTPALRRVRRGSPADGATSAPARRPAESARSAWSRAIARSLAPTSAGNSAARGRFPVRSTQMSTCSLVEIKRSSPMRRASSQKRSRFASLSRICMVMAMRSPSLASAT